MPISLTLKEFKSSIPKLGKYSVESFTEDLESLLSLYTSNNTNLMVESINALIDFYAKELSTTLSQLKNFLGDNPLLGDEDLTQVISRFIEDKVKNNKSDDKSLSKYLKSISSFSELIDEDEDDEEDQNTITANFAIRLPIIPSKVEWNSDRSAGYIKMTQGFWYISRIFKITDTPGLLVITHKVDDNIPYKFGGWDILAIYNYLRDTIPFDCREFVTDFEVEEYVNNIANAVYPSITNFSTKVGTEDRKGVTWYVDGENYKVGFVDDPKFLVYVVIYKVNGNFYGEVRSFLKSRYSVEDITLDDLMESPADITETSTSLTDMYSKLNLNSEVK